LDVWFPRGKNGLHFWMLRIVERHDDNAGVAGNIGIDAKQGDVASAVEQSTRIESHIALQEVVGGIAVDRGGNPPRRSSFILVGDINVTVERMHFLFVVLGPVRARGVGRHSSR